MTPTEKEPSYLKGLPMAMAQWPMRTLSEIAEARDGQGRRGGDLHEARSLRKSRRTVPAYSWPSWSRTTTLSAPPTTWSLGGSSRPYR